MPENKKYNVRKIEEINIKLERIDFVIRSEVNNSENYTYWDKLRALEEANAKADDLLRENIRTEVEIRNETAALSAEREELDKARQRQIEEEYNNEIARRNTEEYKRELREHSEKNAEQIRAEQNRAATLRGELSDMPYIDSDMDFDHFVERYDESTRRYNESLGNNELRSETEEAETERSSMISSLDKMSDILRDTGNAAGNTDRRYSFNDYLGLRDRYNLLSDLDNGIDLYGLAGGEKNDDNINYSVEESLVRINEVLQQKGRITNEFDNADPFTKTVAQIAKNYDIKEALSARVSDFQNYRREQEEYRERESRKGLLDRFILNREERPTADMSDSASFVQELIGKDYINDIQQDLQSTTASFNEASEYFKGAVKAYSDVYAEKNRETLESEKRYRQLSGNETEDEIREAVAEKVSNDRISEIDARMSELAEVQKDIVAANNANIAFKADNLDKLSSGYKISKLAKEIFKDDIELGRAKLRERYSSVRNGIDGIKEHGIDNAVRDAFDSVMKNETDENIKREARNYIMRASRQAALTAVAEFENDSENIDRIVAKADKAAQSKVLNGAMTLIEKYSNEGRSFEEIREAALSKAEETIVRSKHYQGMNVPDTPVGYAAQRAVMDILNNSLRPSFEEAAMKAAAEAVSMWKDAKNLEGRYDKIIEGEPIEYGSYNVRSETFTPENDPTKNNIKRSDFSTIEEYIKALENSVAEKERLVAENDALIDGMKRDVEKLRPAAEEVRSILDDAYKKIDDIDKKYEKSIREIGQKEKELRDEIWADKNTANVYKTAADIRDEAKRNSIYDDFRKKSEFVEKDIVHSGGFIGMPDVKVTGKRCTLEEYNAAKQRLAYIKGLSGNDPEKEKGRTDIEKMVLDEQEKAQETLNEKFTFKLGDKVLVTPGSKIGMAAYYSMERERRNNYDAFFTKLLDTLEEEKTRPGAVDEFINGGNVTIKGLITDTVIPITPAMKEIAENAKKYPEVRELLADEQERKLLREQKVENRNESYGWDDNTLSDYVEKLDKAARNGFDNMKARLEQDIASMENYIDKVSDYYREKKAKDANYYNRAKGELTKMCTTEKERYSVVTSRAKGDEYLIAYDNAEENLREVEKFNDLREKLVSETIPSMRSEIEAAKLEMAKAQVEKDVLYADNLARGKDPCVVDFKFAFDRLGTDVITSDTQREYCGQEVLAKMMDKDLQYISNSASSAEIIDSICINGISARDYYKGSTGNKDLSDSEIKVMLENELGALTRRTYGLAADSRPSISDCVISYKDEGVMRPLIFETDYLKNMENMKSPSKPSEPSKWFKSSEAYEEQMNEYRAKSREYEKAKKEYDFAKDFLKKGSKSNEFYRNSSESIAGRNSLAEEMCGKMNDIAVDDIKSRLRSNSLIYAEAEENKKSYDAETKVVRKNITELTRITSKGRTNTAASENKTKAVAPKERNTEMGMQHA